MRKTGILLINLGTIDRADSRSVYRYLTQFLNDPRVVDLPLLLRWILINFIIVPFRYKKTLDAYLKIWTEQGSPLWLHSVQLKESLTAVLGENYQIELGMRY